MHPVETAAPLKGLVNVSALLWGSQASATSAVSCLRGANSSSSASGSSPAPAVCHLCLPDQNT